MAKKKQVYFCRVLLKDFTSRAWPQVEKLEHFLAYIVQNYPGFRAIAVFENEGEAPVKLYNPIAGFEVPLKYFLYKEEWFSHYFDEPQFGKHLREEKGL